MKVLYFAWLRERLNRGEDTFDAPTSVVTVSDLLDWIGQTDEAAQLAFENRTVIKAAIDEEIVDLSAPIAGANTIAIFPPMTGG